MMVKPILVVMVWRGGDRFLRCLRSIDHSSHYFSIILISVTSDRNSPDMFDAMDFASAHQNCEVICTGVELPTMRHQDFWFTYLENARVNPEDWIYQLTCGDQAWPSGLATLSNSKNKLDLDPHPGYFGPWAMRHEQPDVLCNGSETNHM